MASKFKTSPKQTILVDQIETCKQMALHGIGYAILPSVTLEEEDKVNKMPLLDTKDHPIYVTHGCSVMSRHLN